MKRIIIILAAMVAFAACKKETGQPVKPQHCAQADSINQAFHKHLIMSR